MSGDGKPDGGVSPWAKAHSSEIRDESQDMDKGLTKGEVFILVTIGFIVAFIVIALLVANAFRYYLYLSAYHMPV